MFEQKACDVGHASLKASAISLRRKLLQKPDDIGCRSLKVQVWLRRLKEQFSSPYISWKELPGLSEDFIAKSDSKGHGAEGHTNWRAQAMEKGRQPEQSLEIFKEMQ